jgi:hypothetical protein
MPITPLHLGPGLVLKAVVGKRISITVFALSQIFMDLEVIGRLALNADRLHGFTNTILGASFVLLPAVLIGRPVCQAAIDWWNRNASTELLIADHRITWSAACWGAGLGVYTHWFLDAMMHADARPYWPLTDINPMISWLAIGQINLLCLVLIAGGGIVLGLVAALARKRS